MFTSVINGWECSECGAVDRAYAPHKHEHEHEHAPMKSYEMTHVAEVELLGATMLGCAGYCSVVCEDACQATEALQGMTGGRAVHPSDWPGRQLGAAQLKLWAPGRCR